MENIIQKKHFVYILRCSDGTFYTGYTTDPERRTRVHNSGKGAKYTRSRRPVELIYTEEFGEKVEAQRREYAIKQLTRAEKEQLIRMNNSNNLKRAIEICGLTGVKALKQEVDGDQYRSDLLKVLEAMKAVTADEIRAIGYPVNIQNTLLMDRQLIDDTLTEEIDQLSLLNTVVTYIECNAEGMPEHSAKYMDRVTDLRKVLEQVYDKEAMRFCGSDGC